MHSVFIVNSPQQFYSRAVVDYLSASLTVRSVRSPFLMCTGDWLSRCFHASAAPDRCILYREQYVCMRSSCAECAIDAKTLLTIITSSNLRVACVCVILCECVLRLSWPLESRIVAACQRALNSSSSASNQWRWCRGRFKGRWERLMKRK